MTCQECSVTMLIISLAEHRQYCQHAVVGAVLKVGWFKRFCFVFLSWHRNCIAFTFGYRFSDVLLEHFGAN